MNQLDKHNAVISLWTDYLRDRNRAHQSLLTEVRLIASDSVAASIDHPVLSVEPVLIPRPNDTRHSKSQNFTRPVSHGTTSAKVQIAIIIAMQIPCKISSALD
jgi:hypothetical protein